MILNVIVTASRKFTENHWLGPTLLASPGISPAFSGGPSGTNSPPLAIYWQFFGAIQKSATFAPVARRAVPANNSPWRFKQKSRAINPAALDASLAG